MRPLSPGSISWKGTQRVNPHKRQASGSQISLNQSGRDTVAVELSVLQQRLDLSRVDWLVRQAPSRSSLPCHAGPLRSGRETRGRLPARSPPKQRMLQAPEKQEQFWLLRSVVRSEPVLSKLAVPSRVQLLPQHKLLAKKKLLA